MAHAFDLLHNRNVTRADLVVAGSAGSSRTSVLGGVIAVVEALRTCESFLDGVACAGKTVVCLGIIGLDGERRRCGQFQGQEAAVLHAQSRDAGAEARTRSTPVKGLGFHVKQRGWKMARATIQILFTLSFVI